MSEVLKQENAVLAPGLFAELVNMCVENGLKVEVNPDGSIAFYSIEPKQWMPCYPLRDGWRRVFRDMNDWWRRQKDILPPTSRDEMALRKIGVITARLCGTHSRYPDCYVEGLKSIDAIANNLLDGRPKELNDRMQMDMLETPFQREGPSLVQFTKLITLRSDDE